MGAKHIKFNKEAKDAVLEGIDLVAKAVGSTLGPMGKCVVISDYTMGKPYVTKDGVTVAKNIEFHDKYQNAGAQLIKEAALKTVEKVGDSTTTSIILSDALVKASNEYIENGVNPIVLKREINDAYKLVDEMIAHHTLTIANTEELNNIATISGNNDPEIGKLIGDAYEQVGKSGIVLVEESTSSRTYCDTVMGMQIASGYVANHFVTDRVKDRCELNKPCIFITEHRINNARSIAPILNFAHKEGRGLLIIAQDYDDAALEAFKLNKLQGLLDCCLVKAPLYGEMRSSLLQDLAVVSGATVLTYDSRLDLSDVTIDYLGSCEKAIITKDTTTLIKGLGLQSEIDARIAELTTEREQIMEDPSLVGSHQDNFLQERIARLSSGIATIKVGGITELEMKERKDRIDDAVCATKAALLSGYVRGGGVTYKDLAIELEKRLDTNGAKVLITALKKPIQQLMESAGLVGIPEMENAGYDILTGKYEEDILNAKVIDPAAACKEALANAISIVNLFLSLGCVITPLPEITII